MPARKRPHLRKNRTAKKRRPTLELLEARQVLSATTIPFDVPFDSIYNVDGIYNRTGGTDDPTQDAIDLSAGGLVTDGFALAQSVFGNGLPNDGFFPGTAHHPAAQLSYSNDSNGDSVLYLPDENDSASFPVFQDHVDSVFIYAFATDGATDMDVTAHYEDGSSGQFSTNVSDWFDDIVAGLSNGDAVESYLIDGMDRVSGTFVGGNPRFIDTDDPAVFAYQFPVDQSKFLTRVTVENAGSASEGRALVVLGATAAQRSYVVDTTDDIVDGDYGPGELSLREAVELSNQSDDYDVITFDESLAGQSPILLNGSEIEITEPVSILGLGADNLTIDADDLSQVINIASTAGSVEISHLTISGGFIDGDGGAMQIDGGNVVLDSVDFRNNTAVDDGGAISTHASSNVTIVDSTFANNVADDPSGAQTNAGGAIINRGTLTILSSTLHNNSAESGGAIWTNGTLTLESSTVSNNFAADDGGGLRPSNADDTTILDSTITENTVGGSGDGGGISSLNSGVWLQNTVVAGNTQNEVAENLAGGGFSGDYNLVGSSSGGDTVSGSGNVTSDQPVLAPLADNGGPTLTHLPLDGSPVIDAGLPFDNDNRTHWFRLDESTGSTAIVDSVGNVEGVVDGSGVALGADSPRGTAATFSGGGIQLDRPLNDDAFSELTIEAWVKVPTDTEGRVGSILGNFRSGATTTPQANFEIRADGKLRVYMQIGSSQVGIDLLDMTAQTDLRDGKWHHVALVRQEFDFILFDVQLFVDGVLEADEFSTAGGLSFGDSENLHWIGSDNRNGGLPFQGEIAEVAMHAHALSASELAQRVKTFDQRGDSFDRVVNDRLDIGAVEAGNLIPLPDGDFNDDGNYDCLDADSLVAEIAIGGNDPEFDLTGDDLVDAADLTFWLTEAGAINNLSGGAYRPGDANLDGVVDISDFNLWNANKFTTNGVWCSADFNADGVVDISDFNVWNANKFTSSDFAFGKSLSRLEKATFERDVFVNRVNYSVVAAARPASYRTLLAGRVQFEGESYERARSDEPLRRSAENESRFDAFESVFRNW